MNNNLNIIQSYLLANDVNISGVADISKYFSEFTGGEFHPVVRDAILKLPFAVSFAFRLSAMVMETVENCPNSFYAFHYRRVNQYIDTMEVRLSSFIENHGFNAMPVPASQVVSFQKMTAHISHRHIAYLAGLGWYGRNNLLVHPEYGSRLRFGTVFTDMPLPAGVPLDKDCGSCFACVSHCPAGAINKSFRDFDKQKCMDKLKEFSKIPGVADHICGVCVKFCRGGKNGRG